MNVETRMYVVDLLESYQKRSKQIELLHYELSHPDGIMYLDDSYFALNTVHNGYELEKVFGIRAHMLSECFDKAGGAQEVMPPTKPFTSHSTTRRGLIT